MLNNADPDPLVAVHCAIEALRDAHGEAVHTSTSSRTPMYRAAEISAMLAECSGLVDPPAEALSAARAAVGACGAGSDDDGDGIQNGDDGDGKNDDNDNDNDDDDDDDSSDGKNNGGGDKTTRASGHANGSTGGAATTMRACRALLFRSAAHYRLGETREALADHAAAASAARTLLGRGHAQVECLRGSLGILLNAVRTARIKTGREQQLRNDTTQS
jgi:hypothetical protein